jgi:hypothetical protein
VEWEGSEALEARTAIPSTISPQLAKLASPERVIEHESAAEESSDEESEDEYIAEDAKPKIKVSQFIVGLGSSC